ncbi:MAG: DUF6134 family protein [Methylococcales bacterium]
MKRIDHYHYAWLILAFISFAAPAEEWRFGVFLDAKPIGEHRYILSEKTQGSRELVSQADFNVELLFVNVYRYHHVAREIWDGDCLRSLEARTEENQEISVVQGKQEISGFTLHSPGHRILDSCVMNFAYWNPKMLRQSRLLNPQTGAWQDTRITRLGKDWIEFNGKSVEADHYKLEAPKIYIELWYRANRNWLALKSITPEGYVINYKLQ